MSKTELQGMLKGAGIALILCAALFYGSIVNMRISHEAEMTGLRQAAEDSARALDDLKAEKALAGETEVSIETTAVPAASEAVTQVTAKYIIEEAGKLGMVFPQATAGEEVTTDAAISIGDGN